MKPDNCDFECLHDGSLYIPSDPAIMEVQTACLERLYEFNATRPSEEEKRQALLREMLAEVGEGCHIEPPFHANWGGRFIHLGNHVYINFGFKAVDDTHIYIGDCAMLGPGVLVATAGHPVAPELRGSDPYQYNLPVRIGANCWLGGNVTVLPGVTVGDGSVVGAGSVVTRDIPPGVVAAGNPCRVLREINERDREYFYKDRKVPDPIRPNL